MSGMVHEFSNHGDLKYRTRTILFATIAEYVATGRPVSSLSVAKRHKTALSSATVRRELHTLSEMGFLYQPHKSAGRVPTDRAFRLFVDTLQVETASLHREEEKAVLQRLRHFGVTGKETWQEIVRLLSNRAYQAALVITPAFAESVLKQLRFVPLGPGSLLAVLVTQEGIVHNAFVESNGTLTERDLERIHNYLESVIVGHTLNEIRAILRQEMKDARDTCDALRERATLLGSEALEKGMEVKSELVVEGRSHLAAQPDLRDRLEELMRVLEEKNHILALLDQAAETTRGPVVVIGQEGGKFFHGCAMISAPFGRGHNEGRVGVIGSSRMNYSAIIPLVGLAAEFLTSRLSGENRDG